MIRLTGTDRFIAEVTDAAIAAVAAVAAFAAKEFASGAATIFMLTMTP
jgi:hypothetical protein